jgi:hypothetical protein
MMAQREITPPRRDPFSLRAETAGCLKLVAVASAPAQGNSERTTKPAAPVSFRLRAFGATSRRIRYTRIVAYNVARSAGWLFERAGKTTVHDHLAGAMVIAPSGVPGLPQNLSGIRELLRRTESSGLDHEAVAAAIVALRTSDATIVGPLSPEDAARPGLLLHLAELAGRAYRALRPPCELVADTGFGQVARQFHFIQMSHHVARWMAAGAVDIGVLGQCLRRLQGDRGEFAITAFRGHGVLWAENRFWEIDPIGDRTDEAKAEAAFSTAWVVARRFFEAPAADALAYARSAAMGAIKAP